MSTFAGGEEFHIYTFMTELLAAIALINGPPDGDVPISANTPLVPAYIQQVAVAQELLDPRAVGWMFVRPEDFVSDVNLVRRRLAEFRDAPRADDALRFPPRDLVGQWLDFNRAYRQQLEATQWLYPPSDPGREWYRRSIAETDLLYQIYDAVRDSRQDLFDVPARRRALIKLRDLVGPDAYYSGQLPPHVPVWRFRVID